MDSDHEAIKGKINEMQRHVDLGLTYVYSAHPSLHLLLLHTHTPPSVSNIPIFTLKTLTLGHWP